jgi:hypothetical protein
MASNRHCNLPEGKEVYCYYCGKKIGRDEHSLDFQGISEDGKEYVRTWFHFLCFFTNYLMIMMKEGRHIGYHEKINLTAAPRNVDMNHLKIENYKVRD